MDHKAPLGTMLLNLVDQAVSLLGFMELIAVTMGLHIFIHGLFKLLSMSNNRQMMTGSQDGGSVKGIIIKMVVAGLLVSFAFSLETTVGTFFVDDFSYALLTEQKTYAGFGVYGKILGAIILLIRVFGVGIFLRGLYLWSKAGDGVPGSDFVWRGSWFVMCGGFMANCVHTFKMFEETVGISFKDYF